jgi:predicted nucleic acid-binding protein
MARQKKVVDASILVKWFAKENGSDKTEQPLEAHVRGDLLLIVPELVFLETLNALRYKGCTEERLAVIARTLVNAQFHTEMLNVLLLEKTCHEAIMNNLTIYDALYAALAQLHDCPLVTADEKLKKLLCAETL